MPTGSLQLPNGAVIPITYLNKGPYDLGEFTALQALRSGKVNPDHPIVQAYEKMTQWHAKRLASLMTGHYGAIARPPSSHCRADPYRIGLRELADHDLSYGFRRGGNSRSGDGCTLAELIGSTDYQASGCEARLSSIVIVDEIVASGRTVAAMIHHLLDAGVTARCEFVVATPLWIPQHR